MKNKLINAFELLSKLEDNQWKIRAYKNAAYTISRLTEDEILNNNSFTYLPGIGTGISDKIIEFRTTGKIDKLEVLKAQNGYKLNPEEFKVRKGYISKRIPYSKASQIVKEVGIKESPDLMLVGSYRRKSNNIADLDLLAFTEDMYWSEVGRLSELPSMTLLASGPEKSSFRFNNPEATQIDVNNGSHGNKWTQLLHHTGSKDSNIRLRSIAKKLGYSLNQYALNGYDGEINSEQDIFNILGVPYVKPENR